MDVLLQGVPYDQMCFKKMCVVLCLEIMQQNKFVSFEGGTSSDCMRLELLPFWWFPLSGFSAWDARLLHGGGGVLMIREKQIPLKDELHRNKIFNPHSDLNLCKD